MLAWTKEIVYVISCFALSVSNIAHAPPHGEFDPARPNIVLVYGMGMTPPVMLPLKTKLEEARFNVLIADIGWARGDIDNLAKRLDEFLTERGKVLSERHGLALSALKDDVILFGHSMGGLVIIAAQIRDRKLLEFRVVSAGTPFRGAAAAHIAFWNKAARQMRPDSRWLENIREDMRRHPRKLFQIRAKKDELVPADSSALEGYPSYAAPITGHAALIFELDPEVLKQFFPDRTWPESARKASASRNAEIQSP